MKSLTSKTEAELVLSLSHPRIIKAKKYLPEVSISKQECLRPVLTSALVLEHATEGDLLQLIQKHQGLPEIVARTYFHQILDAIEYLHTAQICHLDIKPENVLLDKKFSVKLTDFGFAQKVSKEGTLTKVIGTKPFLTPEMHARQEYNAFQSDLFALGLTLFIMVSGMMPFSVARADDEIYSLFKEEKYQEFWEVHEGLKKCSGSKFAGRSYYSGTLKSLMNSMLAYKPENRLDLSQIRSHAWSKGSILSEEELDGYIRGLATK